MGKPTKTQMPNIEGVTKNKVFVSITLSHIMHGPEIGGDRLLTPVSSHASDLDHMPLDVIEVKHKLEIRHKTMTNNQRHQSIPR
jgi:hypothetical protein